MTLKSFILLALFSCAVAEARTLTVTSSGDTHDAFPGDGNCGDCTLRAALEEANANAQIDSIVIQTQLVNLRVGSLILSAESLHIKCESDLVTIDGVLNPYAASSLAIQGNNNTVTGLRFVRSRGSAITITGAGNVIGSGSASAANVFVANCLDRPASAAIVVSGNTAKANSIVNNYIGTEADGVTARGNAHGILVMSSSTETRVTDNLISGNQGYGVLISNARQTLLEGNIIGPDIGGFVGPGNDSGGIHIADGANSNVIGSTTPGQRNLISTNSGNGITLSGVGTSRNEVTGNHIGTDITGRLRLGNLEDGIRIENGASENVIGGDGVEFQNLISGNNHHGVAIVGQDTHANLVAGNLIGTSANGFAPLGNGQLSGSGVFIAEGARNNTIGLPTPQGHNVLAGNTFHGLHFSKGAHSNIAQNNIIGLNATGTSSLPNLNGIVLDQGAHSNLIGGDSFAEGNLISGNRADQYPDGAGIVMYDAGTSHNIISANYIGCDASGTRFLRNASTGILIGYGASHNRVGGVNPGEGNVISGNGTGTYTNGLARGIQIFGAGTSNNEILGNIIGGTASMSGSLANHGHGIGLFGGAQNNVIGNGTTSGINSIVYNEGFGIYLSDSGTAHNRIETNHFEGNDSLAIAIRNGAQGNVSPPSLLTQLTSDISGLTDRPFSTVELYSAAPDDAGRGEGKLWLARTISDSDRRFSFTSGTLSLGDSVTVLSTDPSGNTSEFSMLMVLETPTSADEPTNVPREFSLHQNYPNPFNAATRIVFTLGAPSIVTVRISNCLGQVVATLVNGIQLPAGKHSVEWNGRSDQGSPVATGLYFCTLSSERHSMSRRMLLLK